MTDTVLVARVVGKDGAVTRSCARERVYCRMQATSSSASSPAQTS